jgi:hypothetical protein
MFELNNLILPLVSTVIYLLVNHILAKYNEKLADLYKNNALYKSILKTFSFIHNLVLCGFSVFIFIRLYKLLKTNYLMFDHVYLNTYDYKDDVYDKLMHYNKLFAYSKILEFVDTFILELMGKKPIFLQTFHHFGGVFAWFFALNSGTIMLSIVTMYNSLVHSFMYAYYAITIILNSFKIKIPNYVRLILTTMQITHQFLCYYYSAIYLIINYNHIFTHYQYNSVLFFELYGTIIIILFLKFYYDNYIRSTKLKQS